MDDKLFIIAIGGTGMRCLESFVHLCAAGMMDGKTIDILTLDTDQTNGNKGQVEKLIDLYNKVKTNDSRNIGGEARSNTFFSAKLNLYKFYTDYNNSSRSNFLQLSDTRGISTEKRVANAELAELFFDPETVQRFPLDHGYRAQTHLGSMLMYHGILEAAIKAKRGGDDVKEHEKALKEFLQLINSNAANARVFVFGSVFGGTGASSIPVIPVALRDALGIITDHSNDLDLDKVKFGSTLLTDYFKFDMPDDKQRSKDKVIADSNNFALNSQAALNFYNNDLTVRQTYKLLYHIGWPANLKIDYSENRSGDVITGGNKQKNACHVVELMSASAALDFFTRETLDQQQAEYVYRTVETSDSGDLRLTGASFAGDTKGPVFEQKLGNLLSLSHVMLSHYKGGQEGVCGTLEFLNDLKNRNVDLYKDMPDEQARQIDEYLKEYAYKFVNGNLEPGWLHQIFKSVGSGTFIFSDSALSSNPETLRKVDPGAIYSDNKYNWNAGSMLGIPRKENAINRVDNFISMLQSGDSAPTTPQGVTLKEKFIGNLYNAIAKTQKTTKLTRG